MGACVLSQYLGQGGEGAHQEASWDRDVAVDPRPYLVEVLGEEWDEGRVLEMSVYSQETEHLKACSNVQMGQGKSDYHVWSLSDVGEVDLRVEVGADQVGGDQVEGGLAHACGDHQMSHTTKDDYVREEEVDPH